MSRRSSVSLDDIWHHFLEVIILPAPHPGCHGRTELPDAFLQLRHVSGLVLIPQKILHRAPHVFNWVQIWAFCRALPPINLVVLKKGLNVLIGVFGVIILVQSVPIRICHPKEWDAGGIQNVSIPCCCHDPSRNDELCGTSLQNSCPHMNLWGMLMSVLELSWSILLSKGLSPVAL